MSTPHYVGYALFIAGWTSFIWAPVIIGFTAGSSRFRWPAAIGVAASLLAIFSVLFFAGEPAIKPDPDCESLEELEKILCREGQIAQAWIRGTMMLTMIPAALLASVIFYFGWRNGRNIETRKVAH
ncbi:hypothetical protein [Taklimakanibacter albus]|uniref:Uncharacterized protein n=1 Tax=Taklimakanibacter albus TaxID=2800327 RepID=A0ACC5R8V6_9HYPH|nr:hypothetical protein [Aestuariivirga sp. YIM B02566]MBK1869114.1 hypothetical protein [Aestuariivirga sp. YIM B02566]